MESESPQQLSHGLLRFRSAPSFLLDSFTGNSTGKGCPATENVEEDKFRSRFMGFSSGDVFEEKPRGSSPMSPRGYPGLPPRYPRARSGLSTSLAMDHHIQPELNSSDLPSQRRPSPGLFSQLSTQNGYSATKGSGNNRAGNGFEGELNPTDSLKSLLNCQPSLGMLSRISDIGNGSMGEGVPEDSNRPRIGGNEGRFLSSGFHFNSCNDTRHFSVTLASMRERNDDMRLFSSSQKGELGKSGFLLSHQLSLPRSLSNLSTEEKFLQFQDSVPCKIRAKRGCATHPRSIAERVRRTRISERMRKLQELVPDMDKQTNTADKLDLAVEYIKDLQKQFKTLSDVCSNCRCSNSHK